MARGGSIVATHETSLYDEWGVRRADFGLADSSARRSTGSRRAHAEFVPAPRDRPRRQAHPLLAGLEDAGRIINGANQVDAHPAGDDCFTPLRVVPSYPDLPMESVFTRPGGTHVPRRIFAPGRPWPRRLLSRRHRSHILSNTFFAFHLLNVEFRIARMCDRCLRESRRRGHGRLGANMRRGHVCRRGA